jgi:hypothetical protein
VGERDGQPILEGMTFTDLGGGSSPTGVGATTFQTATGQFDAELVRVVNAVVSSVTPGAEGTAVVMDDGTGAVTMLLDNAITFDTSQIVATADLTVTGLVSPAGGGVWVLKPRSDADITRNNP